MIKCNKVASHVTENYDYLKRLLVELGGSESYIKDWDIGGKVFLDYINMMQTLEQLKQVCGPSATFSMVCGSQHVSLVGP